MYNFELIIREKTDFEGNQEEQFELKKVEISGVVLMKANEEGEFRLPFLNRKHIKYWIGRFTSGVRIIEVKDLVLIKVENFPHYPVLSKPIGRSKNRITISKIHKSKRSYVHAPD